MLLLIAIGQYIIVELPRDMLVLDRVTVHDTGELRQLTHRAHIDVLLGPGTRRVLDVEPELDLGGGLGIAQRARELGVVLLGGLELQRVVAGEVVGLFVGGEAGVGGRRVGARRQVEQEVGVLGDREHLGGRLEDLGRELDVEGEGAVHDAAYGGDADVAAELLEVVERVDAEREVAGCGEVAGGGVGLERLVDLG